MRGRYSFGVGTASDWTAGSEYKASVPGVIDIAERRERRGRPAAAPGPELQRALERGGAGKAPHASPGRSSRSATSCRLRVTHDQLGADANNELYGGWPMILSGLKTLLETGEDLDTPGSLRYSGSAG